MQERQFFDALCSIRMAAKQFSRQSAKSAKLGIAERSKVKHALVRGDNDAANVHAQNAIRHANESMYMLRLSSRLEGVVSRMETQGRMLSVSQSFGNIVKSLDSALSMQNMEQVTETMTAFETQCDNLQIRSNALESIMGNVVADSIPANDVNSLIQQVAHENSIELGSSMPVYSNKMHEELVERFEKIKGSMPL